jgi:hypothetical protein
VKLLRAIFRRFGYALIPLDAMERDGVRIAIFKVLFEHAAKDCGIVASDADIERVAIERADNPRQHDHDRRTFAAMVKAVEEGSKP